MSKKSNGMSYKEKCMWSGLVVLGVIGFTISMILIFTNPSLQDTFTEHYSSQVEFDNYLDLSIAGLELNKKNPKLLNNLKEFKQWLAVNPEDHYVLTADPHNMLGPVVDKYLRNTSNINFSDAVVLKDTLNKYFADPVERFTKSRPSLIMRFTQWLDKDLPRRKRFDLALTASANDYNKFYISSFINEFRSTHKIPVEEMRTLKEDVLKYLDSNDKVATYDMTFNTTQFDKLRTIFRKNPSSSTDDKLNLYYKIYRNDPLGAEINGFIRYLNTTQLLAKINHITDRNHTNMDYARKVMKDIMLEYPDRSDLLDRAMTVQFIDLVFNEKKKSR